MQDFIRTYRVLDKQCRYYARHLGHVKGLLDNDDWMRVVHDSMTGFVLFMGNTEITNALILFNTRMFDSGNDTQTILKLGNCIPCEKALVQHHVKRMQEININYDTGDYVQVRKELVLRLRKLRSNKTSVRLKNLRDHVLAHNIPPKLETEKATLNDLVRLTEEVLGAVDLAGYLVESSRGVYSDLTKIYEKHTREFLSILPRLSEVERI